MPNVIQLLGSQFTGVTYMSETKRRPRFFVNFDLRDVEPIEKFDLRETTAPADRDRFPHEKDSTGLPIREHPEPEVEEKLEEE